MDRDDIFVSTRKMQVTMPIKRSKEDESGSDENIRNVSSLNKEKEEWLILVLVICVLSSFLLFLFMCKVYLYCKNRSKRQTVQRNRSCSIHACVCRHLPTTREVQNSVYPPPSFAPSNYHSQHTTRICQPAGHFDRLQTAAGSQINNHGQYYSVHTDSERQMQNLSRSVPVINPAYVESADEFESVYPVDHDVTFGALKDLFKRTERSFTQTVCGKLLVSIARCVGHKGEVLYLDNMGISLNVPEGAIKRGDTKLIVLVLNWDLSDNPQMKKEESLVSPVVYVGPHGLKLDKPCTLTFRHCAFNPHQIQVMRSETDLTDQKDWLALCNRTDDSGLCNLTPDECQLKIDTFTLYTCVQAPLDDCVGKKWLQIAVFACPLRKEINHHQVRMYFLNKTNCALQWAIQNEAHFGGKLICPEKVFLFDGNELDMFTETRYLSNGWELVGNENSEKISFLQIWHGQCPHISVCFRRSKGQTSRAASIAIEMSLNVFTFQQTLEENGEKIFIQVFEDDKTPVNENEIRCHHQIDIQINNYGSSHQTPNLESYHCAETMKSDADTELARPVYESRFRDNNASRNKENVKFVINNKYTACPSHVSSNGHITSDAKPRVFPQSLRSRLILMLDPPKAPYGHDWRDLAAMLKLDGCIPKLQTHEHPTAELLNYIESQGKTCQEVLALFREIGREDCVDEIVSYFHKQTNINDGSSREASENTHICGEQNERYLRYEESSSTGSSYRGGESWLRQTSSQNSNSDTFSKETFESKD